MNTRKTFGILFLFLCTAGLVSCLNENETRDKVEEMNAEVSAITSISGTLFTNDPIEGMLVQFGNSNDFNFLNFSGIDNFTYQRGNKYNLRIERTTLANPPADGSIYRYKLIEILSQQQGEGTRENIRLSVSAEIGKYKWGEITQDIPARGMKIQEETDNEWVVVPFNKIEGFQYEEGYNYKLSVEKITLSANQEQSSWQMTQYVLLDIISKKKNE